MADTAEAYKVTVTDRQGNPIVAYVTPAAKQSYVRAMFEEHGNAKVEEIALADLPEGVQLGE